MISVFSTSDNFRHGETIRSLAMSFGLIKVDSIIWNMQQKPVFDMLHELRPDVLFCSSFNINDEILNALDEYKNTKLVIIGDKPETEVTKDCLICYEENSPKNSISYHLRPAANVRAIRGKYNKIYECDVMSVCEQKSFIMNTVSESYKTKIFSFYNHIPDDYRYLGKISLDMFSDLVKSSKVFLEEHDNVQNLMNALANGTTVLTKNKIFLDNDNIKIFNKENIEEILKESTSLKGPVDSPTEILENHTCLSRLSDIMSILGHTKEVSLCKELITSLK